jgi:hypothetical protein
MLESAVPGNSHAAFGGGRLEKYHPWQLAGPLPNYSAVRGLQRFASERQVGIVALHHLRKAPAEDVFDEFNGSMGLMASVDNAIVLRTVNGVNGMLELHRRGRDYEDDTPLAIKGDKRKR